MPRARARAWRSCRDTTRWRRRMRSGLACAPMCRPAGSPSPLELPASIVAVDIVNGTVAVGGGLPAVNIKRCTVTYTHRYTFLPSMASWFGFTLHNGFPDRSLGDADRGSAVNGTRRRSHGSQQTYSRRRGHRRTSGGCRHSRHVSHRLADARVGRRNGDSQRRRGRSIRSSSARASPKITSRWCSGRQTRRSLARSKRSRTSSTAA